MQDSRAEDLLSKLTPKLKLALHRVLTEIVAAEQVMQAHAGALPGRARNVANCWRHHRPPSRRAPEGSLMRDQHTYARTLSRATRESLGKRSQRNGEHDVLKDWDDTRACLRLLRCNNIGVINWRNDHA